MRKLVVSMMMSLDGCCEGSGGNSMALPMDDFFNAHNLERLRHADTLLLGATTYKAFQGYWPAVADNPELSPAVAADPRVADVHRETGRRNNEIQKVVVSDSLTADDTAPWEDTTVLVRRGEVQQAVADLKDRPGQDILTFGSRKVWNGLLAAGLVDELHLMVGAAVLGGGTPAFAAGQVPPLRLLDTRRGDGSDNVLLRYQVIHPGTRPQGAPVAG